MLIRGGKDFKIIEHSYERTKVEHSLYILYIHTYVYMIFLQKNSLYISYRHTYVYVCVWGDDLSRP